MCASQAAARRIGGARAGTARGGSPLLIVGALGVVFGDIGTSPLYAMRTVLRGDPAVTAQEVYGATSTLLWTMIIIVSLLYVRLLMRTDHDGEGGLLTLVALLRTTVAGSRARTAVSLLGMAGAALFLGDSVITPAISVLSAAEGLDVAHPGLSEAVLPLALGILVGLFAVQRVGSGGIARLYGPIMLTWFLALTACGATALLRAPDALQALSPHWAFLYFHADPGAAFLSLGAVVLAVTGAEALYADMGHFGRRAITRAWTWIVFPSLTITYLGEAATVTRDPTAASNPFFALFPDSLLWPAVVLATAATIVASQAVISGSYTVVHQAAGLGFLPALRTVHTSIRHAGQIYVPAVNTVLAGAVLLVVLLFRSSDGLASAYGIAVTLTISVTAGLYVYLQWLRHRHLTGGIAGGALALLVVACFLAANAPRVMTGGWLALTIAALLWLLMSTWWSGSSRIDRARKTMETPVHDYLRSLSRSPELTLHRVPGTAVFLTRRADLTSMALRTVVEQNHALHEHVILLSWDVHDVPASQQAPEVTIRRVRSTGGRAASGGSAPGCKAPGRACLRGISQVHLSFGYGERIDPVATLHQIMRDGTHGIPADPHDLYFVSRPVVRFDPTGTMPRWRQRLFLAMVRLAPDPVDLLDLPRERTVIIGHVIGL